MWDKNSAAPPLCIDRSSYNRQQSQCVNNRSRTQPIARRNRGTVTAPLWKHCFKIQLKLLIQNCKSIDAVMRNRKGEEKNRENGTNSDAVCGILWLWELHSSTGKGQIAPDVIPSQRRDRGVVSVIR